MNDELTSLDIKKMKDELSDRKNRLMPELLEEVKRTRAFGDLSENFEYKAAKQALNRNKSRVRYLEKMISSAKVIGIGPLRMRWAFSIKLSCLCRRIMRQKLFRLLLL